MGTIFGPAFPRFCRHIHCLVPLFTLLWLCGMVAFFLAIAGELSLQWSWTWVLMLPLNVYGYLHLLADPLGILLKKFETYFLLFEVLELWSACADYMSWDWRFPLQSWLHSARFGSC